jgi:phosphoribosylcarboxyaminoimidazole (NCAIR) mutase
MATALEVYDSVLAAHELAAELAGVPTMAAVEAERDAAVLAVQVEMQAKDALQAKLNAAKVEADEVVAEAQDARAKLG